MDRRLQETIRYVNEEMEEIERYAEEGKLTDEGVFARLFQVGKVLVGWDEDMPQLEAIERMIRADNRVTELVNEARRASAS